MSIWIRSVNCITPISRKDPHQHQFKKLFFKCFPSFTCQNKALNHFETRIYRKNTQTSEGQVMQQKRRNNSKNLTLSRRGKNDIISNVCRKLTGYPWIMFFLMLLSLSLGFISSFGVCISKPFLAVRLWAN